jgi:hypothetical protein
MNMERKAEDLMNFINLHKQAVSTGFEPAICKKKSFFDATEIERTPQSMFAKQFPNPARYL